MSLRDGRRERRFAVARTILAELPCPVVVIAAAAGGERSCATGTAMYVSFSPPALAVAVHPGSRTCRLIEASGAFSVALLADDQVEAASIGARSSAKSDKLTAIGLGVVHSERSEAPAPAEVPLRVWCQVSHRHVAGDHILFVGTIVDYNRSTDPAPPLLRQRRRYARLGAWLSDEALDDYPT